MRYKFSLRRFAVIFTDAIVVIGSYYLAFLLRFEFQLNAPSMALLVPTLPYGVIPYLGSFLVFSLYRGIYYFSSFSDLINITKAIASGALLSAVSILFIRQGQFPRSILILHPILTFVGIGGIRFGIRFIKTYLNMPRLYAAEYRYALIVGAGDLGESLLRQMAKTHRPRYKVVGFIDDNPSKWRGWIHGVPILGGRNELARVLQRHRVDEIVIAIASQRGTIVRSVVEALAHLKDRPELRIAPNLEEMLAAPGKGAALRKVSPADLLNREAVHLDATRIGRFLEGKVVLVSGAGGTIGSELCRQTLRFKPSHIVLLENHATSLFYSDADLRSRTQGTSIVPVLGDIRDQALIDRIFNEHRPQIVLHAAAHKHLHQLESNIHEGISNNILGTYYLAAAALKHKTENFLLVSTDKAVQPTSVMGATKRIAELVIRSFASRPGNTRFTAVRFGNVLGSSGSVLEIFQRQIAAGGPITVTDPEVKRFFMTVEEAVQLILQAAAMARGGEIFLLKMGTSMKILDMARNVISLSGLEPDKDIQIRITNLKPGEKMEEELMEASERCADSESPSIMTLRSDDPPLADMDQRILEFEILGRTAKRETLVKKLQELVPTFAPAAAPQNPQRLKSVDPTLS